MTIDPARLAEILDEEYGAWPGPGQQQQDRKDLARYITALESRVRELDSQLAQVTRERDALQAKLDQAVVEGACVLSSATKNEQIIVDATSELIAPQPDIAKAVEMLMSFDVGPFDTRAPAAAAMLERIRVFGTLETAVRGYVAHQGDDDHDARSDFWRAMKSAIHYIDKNGASRAPALARKQ